MNIGQLFIELLADGGRLQAQVETEASKAGDAGAKTLGQRMGAGLKQHATKLMTAGGAIAGAFVAGSVQEFAKFEEKMNEVFTLLPGISADAMGKMSDDVKAFSRETGRTTDEVVPALYQALSAGVPQDNVFEFMRTANKAAVAGAASTTDSINLLSAVTKGYGDTSQEATEKAADLALTTVRLGQTTYPELASSMGKVVPLAAALNVNQEELFASAATLTGVTGNTAEVMTQLRGVLTALIKANPKMAEGLKAIGFANGEAAIESLGFHGTLEALQKATGGNTQELAEMLGSAEALTATLALTGAQAGKFDDNLAEMEVSTGAVDTGFEQMESGISATTRKMVAHLKTFALDVGEQLAGLGPVFTLFGNTAGRAIGAGLGGAASLLTKTVIPKVAGAIGGLAKGMAREFATAITSSGVVQKMSEGVASVIDRIPGSSKVKGALSGAGKFLGTGLGKAFAVGFAAAAIIGVIETARRIEEETAAQQEAIAASVAEQVAKRNVEGLRASQAALKQGIKDLQDNLALTIFDIPGTFQESQIAELQSQLDAVNAALAASGAAIPGAVAGGIDSRAEAVADAASNMMDDAQAEVDADSWEDVGAEIPEAIGEGILSRQAVVADAFDRLKMLMKSVLSPMKEVGRTIGILTSKALAKGLKDKRPDVRAQAQLVQSQAEADLVKLIKGGGKAGREAGQELARMLKSKNPEVRAAAQRIKEAAANKLDETKTPAGNAGQRAGEAFAKRLKAAIATGDFQINAQVGFTIPGRHAGGPVEAGRLYAVNENTPRTEFFTAPTDGRILTHAQGVRAMAGSDTAGGDTYHVSVPITGILRAESPGEVASRVRQVAASGVLANPRRRRQVEVPSRA